MTKKKNFHGTGGKGGLVRQMAFFYRSRPGGTRSGMPQATSKSQAPGNLQQKGLPGATNTEQAKGGNQGLTDTDSASTIHENGGNVK